MALVGYLDEITREHVRGWAWDPERPEDPVLLEVLVDGRPVAPIIANGYRHDLDLAGIGDGRHGFSVELDRLALPITAMVVHVQRRDTAEQLVGSPVRLDAPLELDEPARRAMIALLRSPGTEQALRERVELLAGQAEDLLQRLADRQTDRRARAAARGRKWRWRPEDGPEPAPLARRALVIDHAVPAAARDAGSNAILSHMAALQRLGFEVTFVPADLRHDRHAEALLAAGIAVQAAPWTASVEELLRRQGAEFDLVYLHRVEMAHRYLPLVRHHAARARVVFSVADLQHLRLARQIKVEDRPEAAPHARRLQAQELAAAASCDAVLTHSTVEAALLRKALRRATVLVAPWAIPARPTAAPFAERSGLAFIGNYQHAPNLHAALWLVDEIMPRVWRRAPHIGCTLAGTAMPDSLRTQRDPRIVPMGAVDSLLQVLEQVRMTVAPLAFGAGLKGKVADSLAAGVPCICTPIAAEGFQLPEPLQDLVADDGAGLADAIVRLHDDEAAFHRCREAGLDYAGRAFSETAVDAALHRAAGLQAA